MSAVGNILNMIKSLSAAEKRELKMMLLENASATMSDMESFMTEERFASGMVCPHCGCMHVVRNGHQESNGKQRYLCRDCGKSFDITSNSIVSGTHKGLDVWERYIACMMQGLSIRKTAEICEIHRNTAFNWRHKICVWQRFSRHFGCPVPTIWQKNRRCLRFLPSRASRPCPSSCSCR